MKRILFLCILTGLWCLSSCSSQTEVGGEVFVVTQGAGNYKLGLVTVSAIAEKDMKQFFATRIGPEASPEAEELKAAQADLEAAQQRIPAAEQKAEALRSTANLDQLNDYQWARDEVNRAKDAAYRAQDRIYKAEAALRRLPQPENYFRSLPMAVAQTTTDSDGKYNLKIPRPGRYLITASADRKAGGDIEDYYWAVWVDADGKTQQLTLSNNNFAGPIDSIKR